MKKYWKKQEVQPNSQHEFSALKESIINLESLEQYTVHHLETFWD